LNAAEISALAKLVTPPSLLYGHLFSAGIFCTSFYCLYIHKCSMRCNNVQSIFYFTARSLYMFWVPSKPNVYSWCWEWTAPETC